MLSQLLCDALQKPAVAAVLDHNDYVLDFHLEETGSVKDAEVAVILAAQMLSQLSDLESRLQTVNWDNPQHVEMVRLSYNQIMAPVGVVMEETKEAPKKNLATRAKEAVLATIEAVKKTILSFLGRAREWLNKYFSKNALALKFAQKTLAYIATKKGGSVNMEDKVFYPGHAAFAVISDGDKKASVDPAKLRATATLMTSAMDPKPVHDVILAFLESLGKVIGTQNATDLYAEAGKAYATLTQELEKFFFVAKDGKERKGYVVRVSEDMGNSYFFSVTYPVTKGDRIPEAPVVTGAFSEKLATRAMDTGVFAPMLMPAEAEVVTEHAVGILETQQKWSNGYTNYDAFRGAVEKLESSLRALIESPDTDAAHIGAARNLLAVLGGYSTLYHSLASLKLDYCSKLARAMVAVAYQSALRWGKVDKTDEPAMPTAVPPENPPENTP